MKLDTADIADLNLAELNALLQNDPMNMALHKALSARQHEAGDELAALAHRIAAGALEAYRSDNRTQPAADVYMVATGYFMKGDYALAQRWYELVLMMDESVAAVYQNMVVIHDHFGRHELAEKCRERAYRLQRVFIDAVAHPRRRLLILCVGQTRGNIPFEFLLSAETSQRIKYIIDYASDLEDRQLPAYDLVFNAIGEADVAAPLSNRLDRFLAVCKRPILNHPALVARTRRDLLPDLIGNIPQVQVAPCLRIEDWTISSEKLQQLLVEKGICFPLLFRPLGSHGGLGLALCADLDGLMAHVQSVQTSSYLCSFKDFKNPDGYYRKYRVIYVDRQPYAYHLAIARHWMVHYQTAEMLEHPWKIAEEQLFLQDPCKALGSKAMSAIVDIGQRLDLDYAGIDFTVLADGQVLVFEANATMLAHRVSAAGVLAHKNAYIQRIADAFERLQQRFE